MARRTRLERIRFRRRPYGESTLVSLYRPATGLTSSFPPPPHAPPPRTRAHGPATFPARSPMPFRTLLDLLEERADSSAARTVFVFPASEGADDARLSCAELVDGARRDFSFTPSGQRSGGGRARPGTRPERGRGRCRSPPRRTRDRLLLEGLGKWAGWDSNPRPTD